MDNAINCFSFNYKQILIDEIALEGLEGIGIDLLWRRVEKRISSAVTEKMKIRFWNFIVKSKDISMYQLPEPLEYVEIIDRFTLIDEETGQLVDPPVFLDGPYEYHPVENENEYGSCAIYNTRKLISEAKLQALSYENVVTKYGDRLVMVASIEERWRALAPQLPISYLADMTPTRYCILELIGKSRENGQMTIGKTNLTKITNDSKLLFYNRNYLQQLDLVRFHSLTQIIGGKGVKTLILRLKRFHTPYISSMPKLGKIHAIIDHLLKQPDYSDRTDNVINLGMLTQKHYKKLNKTANIFSFEDRTVALVSSKKSKKPFVKKRFICLTSPSDESSDSEGETTAEPLKCQYKIGVGLLRQAYEIFVEAGLKGHTQIELAQLIGIEFYTARTICRIFKSKNLVREFLEDKGKQRTARYIAVQATKELDVKYAEEKQKLMDFLESSKIEDNAMKTEPSVNEDVDSDNEVPNKKIKLENNDKDVNHILADDLEEQVTEIKVLDGLENSKSKSLLQSSKPTLRQLRFANGILKVMREKLVISGYQTLSVLVSKEINDTPMDTKSLKIFVQKLVTDGQIKVLKMKWPGHLLKYSVLLCAPFVKPTDPIIKSKYKEISMRAIRNKKNKTKKILVDSCDLKPLALSLFNYPRYLKIQKLHEFITKMVYFNDGDYELSDLPEGFTSLVHILPEFTVEFTLANISQLSLRELSAANITNDVLDLKLKNAPTEIFKVILMSSSLQNAIRTNLKILAMLGLIQLIKEPNQTEENIMLSYVFYVNRHAKIIDTTGMWPRRNIDKKKLEKSYYFKTFSDVEAFWQDVRSISTRTTIELDRDSRHRKRLIPAVRLKKDVATNDNGQVLGNGLGPCGFDACFYMELPRFWSTFYSKVKRKQLLSKNPIIKIPKKEKTKPVKKVAKKKLVPNLTVEDKPLIARRRKREIADNVPKWTKVDDKVIMLCKAAITIISPTSQPGCLRLRNIVARDIITLWDPKKLANHCHKRALSTESNSTLVFEKESLVSELRHRPNILHKYDGLLKKMRVRYAGNMSRLILEAKIPMFELVWIMSQLTKSKSYKQRVPCIALSLEDFNAKFTISASSANRSCNIYRTLDNEAHLAAIKEAIIMTVMASFKTEQTQEMAEKIYEMFHGLPEPTLRIAIEQLRKSGAVAAKEKLLNNQMQRFNFQDIIQASYKVSAAYQRKWIGRMNSDFVDNLTTSLVDDLPENGLKGSPELNCMLSELHCCGVLDIVSVTVPVISGSSGSIIQEEQLSVGDILMKFSLKSGSCGWKNKSNLKKLSDMYQEIDYKDIMDQLLRNHFVLANNADFDTNDKIILHLKNKKEAGSTFSELQELTGFDTKTLINKLTAMESENKIKLIGFYENLIVLTEFSKPWTLNLDKQDIIPASWLTLHKQIRYDVFLKWAGVVVNRVFKHPGCSIAYISDASEFLTTRSAQDLCVFLEKCGCVKLQVMRNVEPDLFSEDDAIDLEEFNPYESAENILVFPVKNSLTRYAYLRKKMLEEYLKQT